MVFGFLKKAYAGLVTAVAKPIVKAIGAITGKEYIPITAKEFLSEPVGKALSSAAAVTSIGLGVATLPYTIPVVAKAALAKPVVALVGLGLVSTKGGRELIGYAAEGFVKGGEQLGLAYEKAAEKGEELTLGEGLKAAGLVGAGLVLGAGAPAIIEKTKEIFAGFETLEIPPEKQLVTEKPIGIEGEVPITPETTTITTGKKPYKRRRAKITPSVRQYVRVNVISRSTSTGIRQSHKYLN